MKDGCTILLLAFCLALTSALPVIKPKLEEKAVSSTPAATPDVETALEYERYLKEVVGALESDSEFRKKLDKAPEADIRSGKIAQELEYVNHHVRTKLDEIKRRELERLRILAKKEYELSNGIDRNHMKVSNHLDHDNQHTFEIEDLQKLIKKTSEDLAEADRQRRAEFKEYEMQKEFEREAQLNEMDKEHREKYEHDLKEQQEKHKNHEKVHHPGSKAQLEEVWEKQDHMEREDFDPRTFFMMHDIDGNGFWDEIEVKALFVKELDKVYQSGLPEDDMRERAEEMERMREHVFQETDTNHDSLISFQEFLEQTKREEFRKDPDWATVDQQPQYTHEEYLEFERRRQEEIQRMIAEGQLPPHPNMPQGYYPNEHEQLSGYQQVPQMHYQNPQQQYQQQQQQYQQQQQQYQQHYQQPVQEVQFHPNQAYQVQQQQPLVQQHQPQQQQPLPQQHQPQQQQPLAQQLPPQQHHQLPPEQHQQLPPQQQQQQPSPHQQAPQHQYLPAQTKPQETNNIPANNRILEQQKQAASAIESKHSQKELISN